MSNRLIAFRQFIQSLSQDQKGELAKLFGDSYIPSEAYDLALAKTLMTVGDIIK